MSSEGNTIWTMSRLRAQLAARDGVAPPPTRYVIWRTTERPGQPDRGGYLLPGLPGAASETDFEHWLLEQDLAAAERLTVAVLVIRERLDARGRLAECVLERRRGGADGPYHGNVARVEFVGAAHHVRRYRASREGTLSLLPPADDTGLTSATIAAAAGPESFTGEDEAVADLLGDDAVIIDRRGPNLFEDMAGLSAIIHVRQPNGEVVGCGVGWYGDAAYVLVADFPRADVAAAGSDAVIETALRARGLSPLETRRDEHGLCVIARGADADELVCVRANGGTADVTSYRPDPHAAANEDQRRWMTYAETYEARTVLDAWRTGEREEIAVVSIDADQQAWRHVIDADGIELGLRPANESAAAVLYREHAATAAPIETPPPAVEMIDRIGFAEDPPVPDDSLLAKVLAWSRLTDGLRALGAELTARTARLPVPPAYAERLRGLGEQIVVLRAQFSAGTLRRLIGRVRGGAITVEALRAALDELALRLRDEIALTQVVTLADPASDQDESPFGPLVERSFPAAAYDIEEAARCLALRRPTAAVSHAVKAMRHGLDGLARVLPLTAPADAPWTLLLASVAAQPGHHEDLIEALTRVRRAWRAPGLPPADKYTEEEAAAVFDAVGDFLRAVAARLEPPERRRSG